VHHDEQSRLRHVFHWLDAVRAKPGGRITLKLTVATLGGLLVLAGLILVPLPGPGWLIVIAGLAILAIEFAWARHLLRFTRRQLGRWTHWVTRSPWPVRLSVAATGLLAAAATVWVSLRLSLGIDLVDLARTYMSS